jgi:hypothetical protein
MMGSKRWIVPANGCRRRSPRTVRIPGVKSRKCGCVAVRTQCVFGSSQPRSRVADRARAPQAGIVRASGDTAVTIVIGAAYEEHG